uniref:Ankyrin repeat-containing protein n=1 Tax=Quercus lobata TaxID=97700 RepID=A0A7N2L4C8_QUELO
MNPDVYRAASTSNSSFFEKLIDPKLVRLCPSLVYEKNSKGNTSLLVAVRWARASSTVKLIIQKPKDQRDVEAGGQQLLSMVNEDGDTTFQVAVRYDDDDEFEIVRELMKEDPKLAKHVNNAKESAMFLAVDRENYKMACYILSAALDDCSYAGRHGMNVLHALVLHTSCCKCCSIEPAS